MDDSAHTIEVSLAVLRFFEPYPQERDYIVIEDGVLRGLTDDHYLKCQDGPLRAIEAFLSERRDAYEIDTALCDFYGFNATCNPNEWLNKL